MSRFITARKRSLRRLCFYRCLSVHRGVGACVVARGEGHVWLLGGMHGCSRGACVVAPRKGMRGCSGRCAWLLRGHAWLLPGEFLCSFGGKLAKLIGLYQLLGFAPPWDILDPPLYDQIVPFQCFKMNGKIPCQLLWDSYPKLASDKFLYLIGSS